ncbi:MAG: hypothetical protein WC760_03770 [Bacteroidia bacterium]|jgi:hypothetical protein
MKITQAFLFYCILFIYSSATAQNRISLSNRNPVFLDMPRGYGASAPKMELRNDNQWLNYTTLVQLSDPNLSITAQIVSGSVPEGMVLQLEALPYQGMSKGKQGTPTGKILLSGKPQVIISNIGTAYTGNGRNEGYQLVYTFITRDYSKVSSGAASVYVQFTITH